MTKKGSIVLWVFCGSGFLALAAEAPNVIATAKLNRALIDCLHVTRAEACGCGLKTNVTSARADYHRGLDAYRSRRDAEAISYLQPYVSVHRHDVAAGYFLGLAYRRAGDERDARAVWRSTGAVSAFRERARQSGAIDDYETAIALGDTDPDSYYRLAELLLETGRPRPAAAYYEQGIALDTRTTYQRSLAEARIAELHGDWEGSVAINEAVAKHHPLLPDPYYRLGSLYHLKLRQLPAALSWYSLGASKAGSLPCYLGAGEVERELGRFGAAEEWARRAENRFPSVAGPALLLASTLESEKRHGEADLAYEVAEAREPGSFWPPFERGESALRRGDPQRALKSLTRAAQLNATSPYIYLALGRAYRALGRDRQAAAAFARALDLAPGNEEIVRGVRE